MDELIRINFDSDRPTVSGRDLHAALEVKTAYKDCFQECVITDLKKVQTSAHF